MPPATISEWTWPEKPWHRLHLDLAGNQRSFLSEEGHEPKAIVFWLASFLLRGEEWLVRRIVNRSLIKHGMESPRELSFLLGQNCGLTSSIKGLSGEQEPPIIDVIVSLEKTLGLEVNEPIIQELVEEEDQELTTNELIDLHREQHQEVKEVISSGEEEDENSLGSLPSDQIREICKMWETVQLFVAKHHPNKPAALRATDQFNDNAMSHFREILKKRQKQQSLDQFFDKIEPFYAIFPSNSGNESIKEQMFPLDIKRTFTVLTTMKKYWKSLARSGFANEIYQTAS
ncbi:hypothetical protein LAZ67_14001440 [Cordylochernes scorpioides]|uniref:Uncharacterized protein n=1 Tax=Cordylochernes scorpioides TaxID=51811 RepID=A0ABY6LA34_9ARAC|nr:hypothetical protein LAZ67_14001440 [Cordylochernes scorpioides]